MEFAPAAQRQLPSPIEPDKKQERRLKVLQKVEEAIVYLSNAMEQVAHTSNGYLSLKKASKFLAVVGREKLRVWVKTIPTERRLAQTNSAPQLERYQERWHRSLKLLGAGQLSLPTAKTSLNTAVVGRYRNHGT